MANIITAMVEIIKASKSKQLFKSDKADYGIRINTVGTYLEDFVAVAFSNGLSVNDPTIRQKLKEKTFCYLGSQNFSPDLMMRDSRPAIEVKKHEANPEASLALNSSPPRQKLKVDDTRILESARIAEKWKERKVIYAIGVVSSTKVVRSLQLVYGDCFVASEEHYSKVVEPIKDSLEGLGIANVSVEGNEIGRVNAVDPLKVTYLRIRGMWDIKNPLKIFREEGIKDYSLGTGFTLLAMAKKQEFESLSKETPEALKQLKEYAEIKNVKIINPDNTAQRLDAVLVKYVGDNS